MVISKRKMVPGFSLLEIVIAIALIALIVAVAGPRFYRTLAGGKKRATDSALKAAEQSIELFHADTSAYPSRLEDLVEKPADQKLSKNWEGPYITKLPKDGWNNELVYQLNPKGSEHPYELYSWGPNGEGSPKEEWRSVWGL